MTEARAIASVVQRDEVTKLLIVSSPLHLPRCRLALRRVLPSSCELIPVACEPSSEGILLELAKRVGYWLFATRFSRLEKPET